MTQNETSYFYCMISLFSGYISDVETLSYIEYTCTFPAAQKKKSTYEYDS